MNKVTMDLQQVPGVGPANAHHFFRGTGESTLWY